MREHSRGCDRTLIQQSAEQRGGKEHARHTRRRGSISIHSIATLLPVHGMTNIVILIPGIELHPLSSRDQPL
jgi:hypothetical protein